MTSPKPLVQILLTPAEAAELYRWMEEEDSPQYWVTPLQPVHHQLKQAHHQGEW